MRTQLHAGFAKVDITPSVGDPQFCMGGIERIIDPVYARVLFMETSGRGDGPVIFVAADHGGFDREADRLLRGRIAEATGVPVSNVRLNGTHNHTCPEHSRGVGRMLAERGVEHVSLTWLDAVDDKIVAAASEAVHNAQPVRAACGQGPVEGIAANRICFDADGNRVTRLGYTRDHEVRKVHFAGEVGMIDPDALVMRFTTEAGEPLVTIINYTCHVTALDTRGKGVSPDFPGYAMDRLERERGGPFMFVQGACGNVGTGKYADGSMQTVRVLADRLAVAVSRICDNLHDIEPAPLRLTHWIERIELDPELPSAAELRRLLTETESWSGVWQHAAMLNAIEDPGSRELDLFVIDGGEWIWAGLPAESFVESALAIRAASSTPFAFVSAYHDCTLWYIPNRHRYRTGGYEATSQWNYAAPGACEQISKAVIDRLSSRYT